MKKALCKRSHCHDAPPSSLAYVCIFMDATPPPHPPVNANVIMECPPHLSYHNVIAHIKFRLLIDSFLPC